MVDTYEQARATAARMLAPRSRGGYGLELTLDRKFQGEYDPRSDELPRQNVAYEGSGFRGAFQFGQVDGTNVIAGDVILVMSPMQLNGEPMPTPEVGDHVLFDGVDYTVKDVSAWNYAGLDCGFSLHARAA